MKKDKIIERPVINIKVEVDKWVNGEYQGRMNWRGFDYIDLDSIFYHDLPHENPLAVTLEVAAKKSKLFKKRLKKLIVETINDDDEIKNMDWSRWEEA